MLTEENIFRNRAEMIGKLICSENEKNRHRMDNMHELQLRRNKMGIKLRIDPHDRNHDDRKSDIVGAITAREFLKRALPNCPEVTDLKLYDNGRLGFSIEDTQAVDAVAKAAFIELNARRSVGLYAWVGGTPIEKSLEGRKRELPNELMEDYGSLGIIELNEKTLPGITNQIIDRALQIATGGRARA